MYYPLPFRIITYRLRNFRDRHLFWSPCFMPLWDVIQIFLLIKKRSKSGTVANTAEMINVLCTTIKPNATSRYKIGPFSYCKKFSLPRKDFKRKFHRYDWQLLDNRKRVVCFNGTETLETVITYWSRDVHFDSQILKKTSQRIGILTDINVRRYLPTSKISPICLQCLLHNIQFMQIYRYSNVAWSYPPPLLSPS